MGLFNKKKEDYKIVNPPTEAVQKPEEEVMNENVFNEDSTNEEEKIITKENKVVEEEKILQVPVFLTQADVNRLIYENNIMLKRLMEAIQKE